MDKYQDQRPEEMEEDDAIVELVDEDGEVLPSEHLATVEMNDTYYAILAPGDEDEDAEEQEVVVMRIGTDDNGEDLLEAIEDEDEMQAGPPTQGRSRFAWVDGAPDPAQAGSERGLGPCSRSSAGGSRVDGRPRAPSLTLPGNCGILLYRLQGPILKGR